MERVVGTRSGSGDAPTDYREDIVRSIFGEVGTPVEGRWSWSMPVVFPRSPSLVCTRRSAFATIAKRAFSRRRRRGGGGGVSTGGVGKGTNHTCRLVQQRGGA